LVSVRETGSGSALNLVLGSGKASGSELVWAYGSAMVKGSELDLVLGSGKAMALGKASG
jgi:hypothetical protein